MTPLRRAERLAWDLAATGASRQHPMALAWRVLTDLEARPIATCWPLGRVGTGRPGRGGLIRS